MHIEFTRPVEVEIHTCLDDDFNLFDVRPEKFEQGQVVAVEPADEDTPEATGFLFWEGGFGLVPLDAYRPVPTLVKSGNVVQSLSRPEHEQEQLCPLLTTG